MRTFKTKQDEIESLQKDIRDNERKLVSHLRRITSDKIQLHSQAIKQPADYGITKAEFHNILKKATKPESGTGQS